MPKSNAIESIVPGAQSEPVKDERGRVFRPALVVQTEWVDPDNQDANSRSPRIVKGYRVVDCLVGLHKGGRGDVTLSHLAAARKYRDDYEIGNGARPGYEKPEVQSASGGLTPSEAQCDAVRDYRAAAKCLGVSGRRLVDFIVLGVGANVGCSNLVGWQDKHGEHRDVAKGRLLAGMDLLVEYYGFSESLLAVRG